MHTLEANESTGVRRKMRKTPRPGARHGALATALAAVSLLTGCGLAPAASYVPDAGPGTIQPVAGAAGAEV
ncbi:MAG TPA: hypothetical protein VLT34_10045, partial [Arthrobacter sp.]|nr:hypothetical protein [Arthrobacter sp.]